MFQRSAIVSIFAVMALADSVPGSSSSISTMSSSTSAHPTVPGAQYPAPDSSPSSSAYPSIGNAPAVYPFVGTMPAADIPDSCSTEDCTRKNSSSNVNDVLQLTLTVTSTSTILKTTMQSVYTVSVLVLVTIHADNFASPIAPLSKPQDLEAIMYLMLQLKEVIIQTICPTQLMLVQIQKSLQKNLTVKVPTNLLSLELEARWAMVNITTSMDIRRNATISVLKERNRHVRTAANIKVNQIRRALRHTVLEALLSIQLQKLVLPCL